jgi:hypothetical protein
MSCATRSCRWSPATSMTSRLPISSATSTRGQQGYRHPVRPALPHAIQAWDRLLGRGGDGAGSKPAAVVTTDQ